MLGLKAINSLVEKAYQCLKKAVGISIQQEEDGAREMSGVNGAHMALATYCDTYLRLLDDGGLLTNFCQIFSIFGFVKLK